MFAFLSQAKADMATDLAILVMAEQGWSAVTLANVGARGNMSKQSVQAWFGGVQPLRQQIAWRYARRWTQLLSYQLTLSYDRAAVDSADVVCRLLPEDEDGIVFTRIWLSLCEAARSDATLAEAIEFAESEERVMVERLLPGADPCEIAAVCALAGGLRAQLCSSIPVRLEEARATARHLLRR